MNQQRGRDSEREVVASTQIMLEAISSYGENLGDVRPDVLDVILVDGNLVCIYDIFQYTGGRVNDLSQQGGTLRYGISMEGCMH